MSDGYALFRRHIAMPIKQHVVAQNNPARPDKIPTTIGIQRGDVPDSSDTFSEQNSPVYEIDKSSGFV